MRPDCDEYVCLPAPWQQSRSTYVVVYFNTLTYAIEVKGSALVIKNSMTTVVRIATRSSKLALWQAEHIKSLLEKHAGVDVEIKLGA